MWTIENKNVLVTGGSSGIGRAAATELAERGAHVTLTSRDLNRAANAAVEIEKATGRSVRAEVLDLADLVSVAQFCDRYASDTPELDALVNNAGGIFSSRRENAEGREMTFATNHLGPFLLTTLLMDRLLAAPQARVVNVSSVSHTSAEEGIIFDDLDWSNRKYRMLDVYGHSKLANILHARGINQRFGPDVSAFAVHPGIVATSFGGRGGSRFVRLAVLLGKPWMRNASEGADTIVWLATEPHIDTSDGIYFSDRASEQSTRFARDDDQADRLWSVSTQLVGA